MRKNFNERYNVNVYKSVYKLILGKEGEHCDYYSLSDLSNEQKIEFIFPSKTYTETDDVVQGFYVIIVPDTIDTTKLLHKNP